MRNRSSITATLLLMLLSLAVAAQSPPPRSQAPASTAQVTDLPLSKVQYRPKLSLETALKIAKGYIKREHIQTSSYWLYRATYTLYGEGPDRAKQPVWHFWWVNDSGALGDYVEIDVFMDGKAMRTPSM